MREYKVFINSKWTAHTTLLDACYLIVENLYTLDSVDLMLSGVFDLTENPFVGYVCSKMYTITINIPPTTITLKKLTKGDINQDEVKSSLIKAKKYYERIHCKTTNKI